MGRRVIDVRIVYFGFGFYSGVVALVAVLIAARSKMTTKESCWKYTMRHCKKLIDWIDKEGDLDAN